MKKLIFEDFLKEVPLEQKDNINQINIFLINGGCKIKIVEAKSGYLVSYLYNKRTLMNYVFSKSGMIARIYGECTKKIFRFFRSAT